MFFGNAVSLHPLDHQISLARQFRRSSFHRPRGRLAALRECWRRGRPRINIQVGPLNGADHIVQPTGRPTSGQHLEKIKGASPGAIAQEMCQHCHSPNAVDVSWVANKYTRLRLPARSLLRRNFNIRLVVGIGTRLDRDYIAAGNIHRLVPDTSRNEDEVTGFVV